MKKIAIFVAIVLGVGSAKAQNWVANGALQLGYAFEDFSAGLTAGGGYEFNDKWALFADLQFGAISDYGYLNVDAFVRYNVWNENNLYFDCKLGDTSMFADGEFGRITYFSPSVRCRVNEKWELSLDLAKVGSLFDDGDVSFYCVLVTDNPAINLIYRF